MFVGLLIAFISGFSNQEVNQTNEEISIKDENSINNKVLTAEIIPGSDNLHTFFIVNRDDFDWNNVKITVNEYYSCESDKVFFSNEKYLFTGAFCEDFLTNGNQVVNTMKIESDEGEIYLSR